MANWTELLGADPTDWLLKPDNPTIRYRTLTELLGRGEEDGDVRHARSQIDDLPLVQDIFAQQHPDGHWGDSAQDPYRAAGTLGVLGILYTLRVSPDERTKAGCDSYVHFGQHESGGLSITRRRQSGITPCSTGEHLPMLVYFGLADDERVHKAFAYLVAAMDADDPLLCGRYEHRPCLWGAIAALKGLAVLPAELRSDRSRRVTGRLCEALLSADYDFQGEHRRWLSFSVPRAWDLLSALTVLQQHGWGADARFSNLIRLLMPCRDSDGRWRCTGVSRTWPLEKRNAQSKWVTLDALLLLNKIGAASFPEARMSP